MIANINYLTSEHIYAKHKISLETFGGDDGIYDYTDGRIESILSQQYPYFGYDKYPSLFQKAAMLLYFFAKGHCFIDGNKRIAIQSATIFLNVNGYLNIFDDLEGYGKTMEVTASQISECERDEYVNSIADWLYERFIPDP